MTTFHARLFSSTLRTRLGNLGQPIAVFFRQDQEPDTVQRIGEALREDDVLAPEIIAAL